MKPVLSHKDEMHARRMRQDSREMNLNQRYTLQRKASKYMPHQGKKESERRAVI